MTDDKLVEAITEMADEANAPRDEMTAAALKKIREAGINASAAVDFLLEGDVSGGLDACNAAGADLHIAISNLAWVKALEEGGA